MILSVPPRPPSPAGRLLPRHATSAVAEALADTRVVLVNGARQSGKSTLVGQLGIERGAQWRSLDRATNREAARYDPTGFVSSEQLLIIDDVQRVPELLLAIKEEVDTALSEVGSRRPSPGHPGAANASSTPTCQI